MAIKRLPSYRSYNARVLFNYMAIQNHTKDIVDAVLANLGFNALSLDPVECLSYFAKTCLGGKSVYHQSAKPENSPDLVNCATFTQWVYAQIGVALPLRAIQQYQMGEPILDTFALKVGDLLFKVGLKNYWDYDDPGRKIGHVGIVMDVDSKDGAVGHATQNSSGVVETTINDFIKQNGLFVAGCRIVPNLKNWTVFNIPPELRWRIKSSDDLKWLILESLPD